MKKGSDDLGDFEERTAKKGESDQFVDPFKRKGAAKVAPDLDGEISEEQRAKEQEYRVKVDENGDPVDKETVPAVQDTETSEAGSRKSKKSKKGEDAGT